MVCELHDDAAWPALLAARIALDERRGHLLFVRQHGAWHCRRAEDADLQKAQQVLAIIDPRAATHPLPTMPVDCAWTILTQTEGGLPHLTHPTARPVDAAVLSAARVYLPVLLGAAAAKDRGAVFVAGHITQTLDGRIACHNGQSQWIGNDADLRHSHRMRALLDGVLVGAGTVLADDPRLTVRHVEGPAPRRLVLSGSGSVLRTGRPFHVFAEPGCDVLVAAAAEVAAPRPEVRVVRIEGVPGEALQAHDVLAALSSRGVHSLYLEGGATTLSSFLRASAVDLLQVHIAAMVLGSGVASVSLPPVDHVRDGLHFAMDHASLDGHVLLSCWPQRGRVRSHG